MNARTSSCFVVSEKRKNASVPGSYCVLEKSIEEVKILAGVPVFKRNVCNPRSRKDCDKSFVVFSISGPPSLTSAEIIFTPAIYVPVVKITIEQEINEPSANVIPVIRLFSALIFTAIASLTVRFSV